jgi:hypothetical protein
MKRGVLKDNKKEIRQKEKARWKKFTYECKGVRHIGKFYRVITSDKA